MPCRGNGDPDLLQWSGFLSDKIEMALRNDISEVGRVLDAVEAFGEVHGLSPKAIFRLNLALDELITNIVSYAFEGHSDSHIELTVELKDGVIDALLIDNGKPFNPVEAELPELGEGLDERRVGGLGIKLVRTHMDRLEYRRDGGFNRLQMHMNLNAVG